MITDASETCTSLLRSVRCSAAPPAQRRLRVGGRQHAWGGGGGGGGGGWGGGGGAARARGSATARRTNTAARTVRRRAERTKMAAPTAGRGMTPVFLELRSQCRTVSPPMGAEDICTVAAAPGQTCGGGGYLHLRRGTVHRQRRRFVAVRLGKTCSLVSGNDNCGNPRAANCGACALPQTCGGSGQPYVCGCASSESDAAFCARLGKNCGSVSGLDDCDVARTVDAAHVLPGLQRRWRGQRAGGCIAETDGAFCARLAKNCGALSANDQLRQRAHRRVRRVHIAGLRRGRHTQRMRRLHLENPDSAFCARLGPAAAL